jgi:drug/metabolite transporter (DMT)-like permease
MRDQNTSQASLGSSSTRQFLRSRSLRLAASFLAVYLIWGSTYLFIRFADETMPPLLMAGTRFVVAGAVLYIWARTQKAERPSRAHWKSTIIVGLLLLVGGNGGVVWAEQVLPSSVTALLISTVPIWIVLLDWLRPGGALPTLPTLIGLMLGFAGVAFLVGPGTGQQSVIGGSGNLLYALIVLLAAVSWAAGSLYSRSAKMPPVPLLGTGMEMLAGGAVLLALAAASGELGRVHFGAISLRSALSLLYLIVFGSLVAFTAYIWLLRNAPVARVATYAYVNPVVAVFLGWAFDHEELTVRTLLAAAVIVAGVVVITTFRSPGAASATEEARRQPAETSGAAHKPSSPA